MNWKESIGTRKLQAAWKWAIKLVKLNFFQYIQSIENGTSD